MCVVSSFIFKCKICRLNILIYVYIFDLFFLLGNSLTMCVYVCAHTNTLSLKRARVSNKLCMIVLHLAQDLGYDQSRTL